MVMIGVVMMKMVMMMLTVVEMMVMEVGHDMMATLEVMMAVV